VIEKKESAKNVARFAGEMAVGAVADKAQEGLLVLKIVVGIILIPITSTNSRNAIAGRSIVGLKT